MFKFEKFLPKKKDPERFAKALNPVDDPIKETLDHWRKVNQNGLGEIPEIGTSKNIDSSNPQENSRDTDSEKAA